MSEECVAACMGAVMRSVGLRKTERAEINRSHSDRMRCGLCKLGVSCRAVSQSTDAGCLQRTQTDGRRGGGDRKEEERGCNIDESCGRRQKAKQSIRRSQSLSHYCSHSIPSPIYPADRPTEWATDRRNDNKLSADDIVL